MDQKQKIIDVVEVNDDYDDDYDDDVVVLKTTTSDKDIKG